MLQTISSLVNYFTIKFSLLWKMRWAYECLTSLYCASIVPRILLLRSENFPYIDRSLMIIEIRIAVLYIGVHPYFRPNTGIGTFTICGIYYTSTHFWIYTPLLLFNVRYISTSTLTYFTFTLGCLLVGFCLSCRCC